MAFNGNEGGEITVEEAARMTAEYRQNCPSGSINAHFFGREILLEILEQKNCEGIRIYYGLDSKQDGKKTQELILVGVDGSENDILDLVADLSVPCPNQCGERNPLNS